MSRLSRLQSEADVHVLDSLKAHHQGGSVRCASYFFLLVFPTCQVSDKHNKKYDVIRGFT